MIIRGGSNWHEIQKSQRLQKIFHEIWSRVYPPSFRVIGEGSLHTVTPPLPPKKMVVGFPAFWLLGGQSFVNSSSTNKARKTEACSSKRACFSDFKTPIVYQNWLKNT